TPPNPPSRAGVLRLSVAAAFLGVLGLCLLGGTGAQADSSVLTKSGTVYELLSAPYSQILPQDVSSYEYAANLPTLALRMTVAGQSFIEPVPGSVDSSFKSAQAVDYEETTDTVFIVYTKDWGYLSDLHVAIRRGGEWLTESLFPPQGFSSALNPQLIVTRQSYKDWGPNGSSVTKTRSIVSIVWWEESWYATARLALLFLEDGQLSSGDVQFYGLNDLRGYSGPTWTDGLPPSSYRYPAVQPDPTTNGGFMVAYANLALQKYTTLRITFPDDLTLLGPAPSGSMNRNSFARGHFPLGRNLADSQVQPLVATEAAVGTFLSPTGSPTFYWNSGSDLTFVRSDSGTMTKTPVAIPLRPDLSVDKGIGLVRSMATKD
ncbi:MAG: hypothetical protein PHO89_11015, partial [Methylacidiphilaceae bacterium]|nr:hypothetical protein [Candidatus Methylacidiphilaceae bacterium]